MDKYVRRSEAAGSGYTARDTYIYTDGFGRTIQVASTGDQAQQWIVSGQVIRDARGRPFAAFVPYFATAADGSSLYSATPPAAAATGTTYDAFSRVTQTNDIDGTVTATMKYHAL